MYNIKHLSEGKKNFLKNIKEKIEDLYSPESIVSKLAAFRFLPMAEMIKRMDALQTEFFEKLLPYKILESGCINSQNQLNSDIFFHYVFFQLKNLNGLYVFLGSNNEDETIKEYMDILNLYPDSHPTFYTYDFFNSFKKLLEIYTEIKDFEYFLNFKEQLTSPKSFEKNTTLFTCNNFDDLPPSEVWSYFEEKLLQTGYLSEEQLRNYLLVAFEKRQIIIFTFNKSPLSSKIIAIFHGYFRKAQSPRGKKKDYVKLLTDYFTGFDFEKVLNNFRS